ncbi:MAG: thioredoxin [Lentisphaerae bacterium RIFOXYA12_FULL_48_11]|nr:MAG: thioredoxin [Lentisphaerae bacterium RIFOXYA12_FULL_48_11]
MNGVKEIQENEFQNEVLESSVPVLVDFFAPWCGPCRALAPALEDIAKTYGDKLKIVKVNVDNAYKLAVDFKIRGVPTLMIFNNGELVDNIVGLPPLSVLRQKLADAMNKNSAAA